MARAVNGVSATAASRKNRNNSIDITKKNAKLAELRRAYRKLAAANDTAAERAADDALQELIAQIPSRTRTAEVLAMKAELAAFTLSEYRDQLPKNELSPLVLFFDVADKVIQSARELAKAPGHTMNPGSRANPAIAGVALLGAALIGFAGGSAWAIPAGALTLAALRTDHHARFAKKYAATGAVGIWAMFFTAAFANRLLWSALAFTTGMALAVVG